MPIVLMVEADSPEDAQKALEDWAEEVDINSDLPVGTEDMDVMPHCDNNDEGQRLLYLPTFEEEDLDELDNDNDEDDFNDGEDDF